MVLSGCLSSGVLESFVVFSFRIPKCLVIKFQKVLFSAKEKNYASQGICFYNTIEVEHCLYAFFRDIMNHKYE